MIEIIIIAFVAAVLTVIGGDPEIRKKISDYWISDFMIRTPKIPEGNLTSEHFTAPLPGPIPAGEADFTGGFPFGPPAFNAVDPSPSSSSAFSTFISRLSVHVAQAEGFYDSGNPRPARNHNPGDLIGDYGWGKDDAGYGIFPDDTTGFTFLRSDLTKKFTGHTRTPFTLTYTWLMFANLWASTSPEYQQEGWATTVTRGLSTDYSIGISIGSVILDTLNQIGVSVP